MNIALSCREAEFAIAEGGRRRLRRLYGKANGDLFKREDPFDRDIEAVAAEMAFSRFIQLPWSPSDGPQHSHVGDVGTWEVRHTKHTDGHLVVYGRTSDTAKCVLVTGQLPEFNVVGWFLAADAKRPEWSRSFQHPTFYVPQSELHTFEAVLA